MHSTLLVARCCFSASSQPLAQARSPGCGPGGITASPWVSIRKTTQGEVAEFGAVCLPAVGGKGNTLSQLLGDWWLGSPSGGPHSEGTRAGLCTAALPGNSLPFFVTWLSSTLQATCPTEHSSSLNTAVAFAWMLQRQGQLSLAPCTFMHAPWAGFAHT